MASAAILRKAGWIQRTDPKTTSAYYYNTKTGATQWEQPDLTPKRAHKQRYTPAAFDHVARGRAYSNDPLEDGWTQALDPKGRPYYYNKGSGATQWERPTPSGTEAAVEAAAVEAADAVAAADDAPQPDRVGDWARVPQTCIHPAYWYNERTKETAWVLPDDAQQQQRQQQQRRRPSQQPSEPARRRSSTFSEGALDAHRTFKLAHRAPSEQEAARNCLRQASGSVRRGSITDGEYAAVKRAVASGELATAGQVLLQASADACAETPAPGGNDDDDSGEAEAEAEAEAGTACAVLREEAGSRRADARANPQASASRGLDFYRARGAGSSGARSRAHGSSRGAGRGAASPSPAAPHLPPSTTTTTNTTTTTTTTTTTGSAHGLLSAKEKRLSKLQSVVEGATSRHHAQSSSLAASHGHESARAQARTSRLRLAALDEDDGDDGRHRAASALFRRGEMEIMRRSKLVPAWKECVVQLNRHNVQMFKMSTELDRHGERTVVKVYETLALADLQAVVEGDSGASDETAKFEIRLRRKRGRSVRLQLPSAEARGEWAAAVRHNMQLLSPL